MSTGIVPPNYFVAVYSGDGSNKTWPYTWPASNANSFTVQVKDTVSGGITVIDPSLYTVNGIGLDSSLWTISYPIGGGAALTSTQQISIEPNETYSQETDFTQQGNNNPKVYGSAWNKCTVLIGQLKQKLSRALVSDPFTPISGIDEIITQFANQLAAAQGYASNSLTYANNAAASASSALASKNAAETSEANALNSANAAALAATNVTVSTQTTLTYAASVAIPFVQNILKYYLISLTGNITFTTTGKNTNGTVALIVTCDATQRTLTFPSGWKWISPQPTAIAASKVGVLSLTSTGTNETDVIASWGVQA